MYYRKLCELRTVKSLCYENFTYFRSCTMIAARSHGRTAAERLAAKKARQEQRKAKSAGAAGGQGPNGQTPMLPLVPQFDSFGRPVTSPSAAARDPYAIPKKSDEDQGRVEARVEGGRGRVLSPLLLLLCMSVH